MREKKLVFFFFLYWPLFTLLPFNTIEAQNAFSLSKKKVKSSPFKLSSVATSQSILTEKQKLFNVLRQLNQTQGIYFLFTDKTFGDIMVEPVEDNKQPVEQILMALLKNTDLKFRKINANTFIILPLKSNSTTTFSAEIDNSKSITRRITGNSESGAGNNCTLYQRER